MEARWSSLAISAHCKGSLDYSLYRRYDAYWEIKEELVLRAVEDDYVCQLNAMAHQWHSCSGAPSGWGDDSETVEFHRKGANKAFRDIGRTRLPWYKRWAQDDGKTLIDLYKAMRAREKDPKYAAHLRKLRAKINDQVAQSAKSARALEEIRAELKQEAADRDRNQRRRRYGGLRR